MLLDDMIAGNNYNGQNWAFQIKKKNMLNNLGFSHVWNNQEQNDIPFKDICGYFQCAPFQRLQTGKVVWVLSFDP